MRRRIFFFAVALTLSVYVVWQYFFFGIHPKLIVSSPAESQPLAALDEPAGLDFRDIALIDALRQIAKQYHVDIDLRGLMQEGDITGKEWVDEFQIDGVTLRSSLQLLLRPYVSRSIVVESQRGEIVIVPETIWQSTLNNFTTKVYPLTDVLASSQTVTEQKLVDGILSLGLFEDQGLPGTITAIPGGLIITQTPDIHRQIRRLLDGLATFDDRPDPFAPIVLDDASLDNRDQLLAALDEPTDIEFAGKTRREICAELSNKHNVPIFFVPKYSDVELNKLLEIDEKAFLIDGKWFTSSEIFLKGDWHISNRWKDISLRSALELMCGDSYSYQIENGVILVAPFDEISRQVSTRMYPIPGSVTSKEFWTGLITRHVTNEFEMLLSDFDVSIATCGDCVIFTHLPLTHREAEQPFRQYALMKRPWESRLDHVSLEHARSKEERRIEQVLQNQIHAVPRTPRELLCQIATEYGVNVWIDESTISFVPAHSLRETGPPPDIADNEPNPFDATDDDPFDADELFEPEDPFGAKPSEIMSDPLGKDERADPFGAPANSDSFDSKGEASDPYAEVIRIDKQRWRSEFPTRDGWPLDLILHKVLSRFELNYVIRHDSLVVVGGHGDDETRLYPTQRLFSYDSGSPTAEELKRLIELAIDLEYWRPAITVTDRILSANTNANRHQQIQALIGHVMHQFAHPEITKPTLIDLYAWQLNTNLAARLAARCELVVPSQTLRSFARWIESEHEIAVAFDFADLDAPISAARIDAPLQTGLNFVLAKHRLITVVRDGGLLITPISLQKQHLPIKIYGVADIVHAAGDESELDLVRMIDGCLSDMHWAQSGRLGFVIQLPQMLVVSHTIETHEAIERCLAGLRRILVEKNSSGKSVDDKIAKAFARPANVVFDRVPLKSAIRAIAREHEIQIELAVTNEDYFELYDKVTITQETAARPLGEVLRKIADQSEVWLSISGDVVFMTNCEALRPLPDLRFHNVSDLIEAGSLDNRLVREMQRSVAEMQDRDDSAMVFHQHFSSGEYAIEFRQRDEQLFEVLAACLFGRQRAGNSFAGSLSGDFALIGSALVISGTNKTYQNVEWLLSQLRNSPMKNANVYQSPNGQIQTEYPVKGGFHTVEIVKVYEINSMLDQFEPRELVGIIKAKVAFWSWQKPINPEGDWSPFTWKNKGGTSAIQIHRDKIVVRQTLLNHEAIDRLLKSLQ